MKRFLEKTVTPPVQDLPYLFVYIVAAGQEHGDIRIYLSQQVEGFTS